MGLSEEKCRENLNMMRQPLMLLLMATLAAGCIDTIRDDIRRRIAGNGVPPPGQQKESRIGINSVQPNRGVMTGGDSIEIVGFGFMGDKEDTGTLRVLFGDVEADPRTFIVEENALRLITPAYDQVGPVDVRVIRNNDAGLLKGGFQFFEAVEINEITPTKGPSTGGTILTIIGKGFVDGTEVQFAGITALSTLVINAQALQAVSPPIPADDYAITVTNLNGSFTVPSAFHAFDPVEIDNVTPLAGPIAGGTPLTLRGRGFVDPSALSLNGSKLSSTRGIDDNELTFTTPAVSNPQAVDIGVQNINGEYTLKSGFVYYDPANTLPRIISVFPPSALIQGGRKINIIIGGFLGDPADTSVYIGNIEASCVAFDAFSLSCIAPSGIEGPADVRVLNLDGTEVIAGDRFSYIDLRLQVAVPNTGAIAGGTYLKLFGNGFGERVDVFFNGKTARDISVISPQEISLRTPRGNVGGVDVRIETQGVELLAENFFNYFDPFSIDAPVSGELISGSINVTVTDGTRLVPNAFVQVGPEIDNERPYLFGFTDQRGQITLSGPDVSGRYDVHAGKADFSGFSWISVDQANLVLRLGRKPRPPDDPPPACPPQGSGFSPLIRGKVSRLKDDYNLGDDRVMLTTSFGLAGGRLPDPGPKAQLVNNGTFELVSRAGDLVLIAIAGTMVNNTFVPHAMGFNPFVFTESGSGNECGGSAGACAPDEECIEAGNLSRCTKIYENVNILIDTPLNTEMSIRIPTPPVAEEGVSGPDRASIDIQYDFGYRGSYPFSDYSGPPTEPFVVRMPSQLPDTLLDATFSVAGRVQNRDGGPLSETVLSGLTDTSEEVLLEPMMKYHNYTSPTSLKSEGPLELGFERAPTNIPDTEVTGNNHIIYDRETVQMCIPAPKISRPVVRWRAVSPGNITTINLPVFPSAAADANIPSGQYSLYLRSVYIPKATFTTMRGKSWITRALDEQDLTIPKLLQE